MKKDLTYGASYVKDANSDKMITKRNGELVRFNPEKIKNAIQKANNKMQHRWDRLTHQEIDDIVELITQVYDRACDHYKKRDKKYPSVEFIQDEIEAELVRRNHYALAKEYMTYRYQRALARKKNTTDESIMQLIKNENKELAEENSNKNTMLASTQRDYIAGEVSRDISQRMLLPENIVKAHKDGVLHFHDLDYFIQPIFNCCLINIKDILDNGTVMNGKMIESPKSFQVACTVMTQVIAAVASNQYGGQSVSVKHLGKYLAKSRDKFMKELEPEFGDNKELLEKVVDIRLRDELKAGVQTIQYQINTLMTTNGQSPFVTLFLHLDLEDEYYKETALIIEEILRQRIEGIKNEKGIYVTPEFPKLIYVLDEFNCLEGGEYDYLTEIAIQCSIKRMYPDYISAKIMREQHDGQVFGIMGCVDGKSVIDYKIGDTRYVESFERAWNRLSKIYVPRYQSNCKDMYINTPNVSIWDTVCGGYVDQYRIIRNTQDKWYDVTFSNGRFIEVTDDHPFEVVGKGVVKARDLQKGDQILREMNKYPCSTPDFIRDDMMWLKGLILCDGVYRNDTVISLGLDEQDIVDRAIETIQTNTSHEINLVKRERDNKRNYYDLIVKESSDISKMFHTEFEGEKKYHRHIPQYIFNDATINEKFSFLAGMIDAVGYINSKTGLVKMGSANRELKLQQMYLAMDLGFDVKMYHNYIEFECNDTLEMYLVSEKKKKNFYKYTPNNHNKRTASPTCEVIGIKSKTVTKYSYDVTTESEHFTVNGIHSHNCRSCLSPWKDENGNYKFEGRFNQGVVSINLPQIAILANKSEKTFWSLLDERLNLCFEALMCRHKALEGTPSDISPIHFQYGAIARLKKGEPIDKLLHDGYSTISLGYIGIYETTKLMKGVSHTDPVGTEFALRVMNKLREATDRWKEETGIGFGLYGTPAESLCYRFARIDKEKFGDIPDVTDKGYYTNSYHVDVREHIDAFKKLAFEAQFQTISSGGAISYIEVPNMSHNVEAMRTIVNYMYHNIKYAEFNTKCDYCHKCGFDGEIIINDDNEWECPNCGNKDKRHLTVTRRTCGYLGANFWNVGKTKEIKQRVLHL